MAAESKHASSELATHRVSDAKVGAIPIKAPADKRPVLGAELFPELYAQILALARKMSGKTSVVYEILKRCVGPDTTVIVFCSTLSQDAGWIAIRDMLRARKIPFHGYLSIFDDNGRDQLAGLMKYLQAGAAPMGHRGGQQQQPREPTKVVYDLPAPAVAGPLRKPRLPKYQSPKYIVVVDDLSDELRCRSVQAFSKRNRHMKCKLIISTQWPADVAPSTLRMMDYVLLFAGHSVEKLKEFYDRTRLGVPFETFMKIYLHATKEQYSFLYVDCVKTKFRRCFTDEYKLRA